MNTKTYLKNLIFDLCKELNISHLALSNDWILKLSKNQKTIYVIDNHFSLNSDSAILLANDKVATYEILNHADLPAVPHFLLSIHFPKALNQKILQQHLNFPLVLKPNSGRQGQDVFLLQDQTQILAKIPELFTKYQSLAICPYLKSRYEYRIFCLNKQAILTYQKENSFSWKHNLKAGASVTILNPLHPKHQPLTKLALDSCQALGLNFATVDILDTKDGFKVLEINSGVSTFLFSQKTPDGLKFATDIYRKVLESIFH